MRWTSWVLQLPPGAEIAARALPEGYAVRTATEDDLRAAHDVLEDAFLEWSERDREPFEDFHAALVGRPGFEPWNLRVVADDAGAVVGVALTHLSAEGNARLRRSSRRTPRPARPWTRPGAPGGRLRRWRASTVRPSPSSAPTRAPARSASTRRSACGPTATWVNRAVRLV